MNTSEHFYKLLDRLEEHLDRGFFLSFIGKIIVDEKKIYSVLNELRSLNPEKLKPSAEEPTAAVAPPAPQPVQHQAPMAAPVMPGRVSPDVEEEASAVRRGADRYADEVLGELENRLNKLVDSVQEGRNILKSRIGSEVK
jgi:hypothetical protein